MCRLDIEISFLKKKNDFSVYDHNMCVIIDSCVAHLLFRNPPNTNYIPVYEWLFNSRKNGVVVIGGKLRDELLTSKERIRLFTELNRAGRSISLPDILIAREEKKLNKIRIMISNDSHILALARASGARTLCTVDSDLEKDFKNTALISNPRGRIYKYAKHYKLLSHTDSCINFRNSL